jgi:ribulose-phosphate 3-epimerase
MILVSASMLSSNLANLSDEAKIMIASGIDTLHMDIMDGLFVNNLSFGLPVVKSLKLNLPNSKLDCHLMVTDPIKYIDEFIKYSTSISFHIESCPNSTYANQILDKFKYSKVLIGIAINPQTTINLIDQFIEKIDYVLIMSVEPGFSGQKFISDVLLKIKKIREKYPNLKIQVDGGINLDNYKEIINAGADILVSGSTLFNSNNIPQTIKTLKKLTID